MKKTLFLLAALWLPALAAGAQEPLQWRGPARDGHYPGTGLLKTWPDNGPALAWSCTGIGKGYSTAVSDGITTWVTGMKDTLDYLSAIGAGGKLLWQVPVGPSWNGTFPDTRCTPTVKDGSVYVISGRGTIGAFSAMDGTKQWSFDAAERFGAEPGEWGVCESLLLSGDKVIYTPAGKKTTLVALDRKTGETVWQSPSLSDTGAYVSPRLITHNGKEVIVTLTATYLLGVDPADGRILWKFDYASFQPEESLKVWPGAPKTNTVTPLYQDGNLYITGGYDHPGVNLRLSGDGSSVEVAWSDTALDCHHGGVVLLDGCIYGSNWLDNSRGNWCCIDWKTGKMNYQHKWFTKGSVITADNMLYIFEEKNGNVGLVRPDPNGFTLAGTFRLPEGKGPCWAHPSIYNGILYIRRGDALMAYDIREKK